MSKKGGSNEQNFFETRINTGFLAPLKTLIYLTYLIYLSDAHSPACMRAVCYHKEAPEPIKRSWGEGYFLFLIGGM